MTATLDLDAMNIEQLRDRCAWLEEQLGLTVEFPPAWRLSPLEGRVLGLLLKRPMVQREQAEAAIWWDRDVTSKVIDVYICHLRKKLAPFGVCIENKWGGTFWLTGEAKAKLRELGARG